jgi:signal transduction histidine kinase
MIGWVRRRDSIARRFVLTVVAVIAGTLALIAIFLTFGGTLAAPPIETSGVLERAAVIYRVIENSAPSARPRLAAILSDKFDVSWFPEESPVSRILDRAELTSNRPRLQDMIEQLVGDSRKSVLIEREGALRASLPSSAIDPEAGALGLALPDGSWLIYSSRHRLWGLSESARLIVWGLFLLLVTGVVTAIAARQMARPIRQFTEAIRLFGTNPQSPPMPEIGPVEFRGVIGAFNTMQGQIQRLISSRTAMLAAISHDLRTPLTRIRLRGEFIHDPHQQARLFRDVDELQQMIEGALAFFRGDAHQESLTSLDLPSILQTIVSDFSDHGVSLDYAGPARLAYLGRPVALKRAVANLVENAVKYGTPPEIRLFSEEMRVVITVRDCGPGIPEDELDRVFQPFFRLETSRNRATGGVGLGLTATQSIIREHGGEVILVNRSGGGLEARINLPDTRALARALSP